MVSRRGFITGSLAGAATIALGATLRLPAAAPGAQVLSARELEIVDALAEALFPSGAFPLDGRQAGVSARVDSLVAELMDTAHRIAFRYALRSLEMGTQASRGRRFSRLDPDARRAVLSTWDDPAVQPRRVALDGLKAVLAMAYFEHPDVVARIGWRTSCGVEAS